MPKLIQVNDVEVLIAMSFWALGQPITCMIGFVMSGLKATGDDKKVLSVSTVMVDGLTYGPANLLLLGVTVVLNMFCYSYIRYALRLQLKEIPSTFTWLYFISYVGLAFLLAFPPVKVHITPFDYGIHCRQKNNASYFYYVTGSQFFMVFSICWMAYFTQWLKNSGGRACFLVALSLAGVLLIVSWVIAAAVDEKSAAPVEWSSLGIIMGCFALVVFICEREKVLKLNSSGFSNQVSNTPQEYEQV
ncbi:hypothetical protein RFI_20890 [Reticulomyxa filosa]|uniref:Uncharacterized protein n=1 Tax=Reticulomyxa filosa TaxID=46433 RepID=X6MSN7_RETFI|nr:hypothetical protein RFI_20890 [Reticulomyxa filosa]|eukprot:ETO16447.1 hypothetical protein RFI_20890 [Reticulomyxa filosa]